MEKEKAFLLWFDQLERKDVAIAGGKSSSLGELTSHVDVPVPYGFATTACAYRYFFEKTGLYEKIKALIAGLDETTALSCARFALRSARQLWTKKCRRICRT